MYIYYIYNTYILLLFLTDLLYLVDICIHKNKQDMTDNVSVDNNLLCQENPKLKQNVHSYFEQKLLRYKRNWSSIPEQNNILITKKKYSCSI